MSLQLHLLIPSGEKWEKWTVLFSTSPSLLKSLWKKMQSLRQIDVLTRFYQFPYEGCLFLHIISCSENNLSGPWTLLPHQLKLEAKMSAKCEQLILTYVILLGLVCWFVVGFFCWEPFCLVTVAASNGSKCKWDEPRASFWRAGEEHCPFWGTTGCRRFTSHSCSGESAAALRSKSVQCSCSVCFHTPFTTALNLIIKLEN